MPLGDADRVVAILRELQHASEARLLELQAANYEELDRHFNFDRFIEQVFAAIESDESPSLLPVPLGRSLAIRWLALRSPYSVLRREKLRLAVRTMLASSRPGRGLLERRRRRLEAQQ